MGEGFESWSAGIRNEETLGQGTVVVSVQECECEYSLNLNSRSKK